MGGKRQAPGIGKRRGFEESGVATATARISLQHVHGAGLDHAAKIERLVAVLARRDLQTGGRAVAQQAQAIEVVARNRLLEPDDVQGGEFLSEMQGLLARIRREASRPVRRPGA